MHTTSHAKKLRLLGQISHFKRKKWLKLHHMKISMKKTCQNHMFQDDCVLVQVYKLKTNLTMKHPAL